MEHTFMMTLDHVGDLEAMVYARSLISSLLRIPLRRHCNRDQGLAPV